MKRLVLCCDGTWNSADQKRNGQLCPTNVVKLGYRIAKRDAAGVPQIVCYDQGVGTGNLIDRVSGGAFGHGLENNIHDAYRFLVSNYERGDEIFLFGFSRGAFTARSIGGMVRKCGVLKCEHAKHYLECIELYRNTERPGDPGPTEFRDAHCVCGTDDIAIAFIGMWDTVGALGIPMRGLRWLTRAKYQFHDTELSRVVKRAYHALAIDEFRAPFDPTLWDYAPKDGQRVEQMWFCGAHSDVGGGYPEAGLSDIALQWMMDKAGAEGLKFDASVTASNPLAPDANGELHDSRTGLHNFSPKFYRTLGRAKKTGTKAERDDPTQRIHESVLERWDSDPKYAPEPLRAYFRRTNDPRARK